MTIYPKNEVPLWNYELLLHIWFAFVCIWVVLVYPLEFRIFPKHGKWSEMLLIMIAEEIFAWSKCGNLQNIWSMRVQDRFELRVGRVIFGQKLLVHIRSKNSSNFSLSFICRRFKLIEIADYRGIFIFLWSVLIMGDISSINVSILAILLLLWGGL